MSLKSDPVKATPPGPNEGKDGGDFVRGVCKPTDKMNDTNSTEPYAPPKVPIGKTGGY
jgi:hypothetical protein